YSPLSLTHCSKISYNWQIEPASRRTLQTGAAIDPRRVQQQSHARLPVTCYILQEKSGSICGAGPGRQWVIAARIGREVGCRLTGTAAIGSPPEPPKWHFSVVFNDFIGFEGCIFATLV